MNKATLRPGPVLPEAAHTVAVAVVPRRRAPRRASWAGRRIGSSCNANMLSQEIISFFFIFKENSNKRKRGIGADPSSTLPCPPSLYGSGCEYGRDTYPSGPVPCLGVPSAPVALEAHNAGRAEAARHPAWGDTDQHKREWTIVNGHSRAGLCTSWGQKPSGRTTGSMGNGEIEDPSHTSFFFSSRAAFCFCRHAWYMISPSTQLCTKKHASPFAHWPLCSKRHRRSCVSAKMLVGGC
jgi:hypothetical protein